MPLPPDSVEMEDEESEARQLREELEQQDRDAQELSRLQPS